MGANTFRNTFSLRLVCVSSAMSIVPIPMCKHCTMSKVLLFRTCTMVREFHAGYYSMRCAFNSHFHHSNRINTFSLIKWKFHRFSLVVQWPRSNGKKRVTATKKSAEKIWQKVSGSRYELNCRHFHLFLSNFERKKLQTNKKNNHLKQRFRSERSFNMA